MIDADIILYIMAGWFGSGMLVCFIHSMCQKWRTCTQRRELSYNVSVIVPIEPALSVIVVQVQHPSDEICLGYGEMSIRQSLKGWTLESI